MKVATAIALGQMLALDAFRREDILTVDEVLNFLQTSGEFSEGLMNGGEFTAPDTGKVFKDGNDNVADMDALIACVFPEPKEQV